MRPLLSEMTELKGTIVSALRGKECGRICNRGVFSNQATFVLILFIIVIFLFNKNKKGFALSPVRGI